MMGRAGGLGFVFLALGCGQAPECFYHGDCASGFRCTADRVCVASSAAAPGTSGNGASRGGGAGGGGRAPAAAVTGTTLTLGDANAWLRGGFGTARLVDAKARLDVWTASNATPEVLTFTTNDETSGMIIVHLQEPLASLRLGAEVAVEMVQVCGDGNGSGTWNYDTASTDGTVILSTATPEADEVEVQVTHGTQQVQARARVPRNGR